MDDKLILGVYVLLSCELSKWIILAKLIPGFKTGSIMWAEISCYGVHM